MREDMMTTASGAGYGAVVKERETISSTVDSLDAEIARLSGICDDLRTVADKLAGCQPREVSAGSNAVQPETDAILPRLTARRDRIARLGNDIVAELQRIQRAI